MLPSSRVECRTGRLALESIQAADAFDTKVAKVDPKSADLEKQCKHMLTELETLVLPVYRIDLIKKYINELRSIAVQAGKAALEELSKKAAETAEKQAAESKAAGKSFVVAQVDSQGDVKAMEAAMKAFLAVYPVPVLMVTANMEEKKIAALAEVPNELSSKLSAKDWVAEALKACGGKGGGKPERAQGQGKEPEKLAQVLEIGNTLATGKLA